MMNTRACRVGALVLCCLPTAGCGNTGLPGTVPVRGKVVYQGRPLGGGEVRYVPVEKQGRVARGSIHPDGSFELTTLKPGDGALAGRYKVVVLLYAPHPGEPGRTVAEPGEAGKAVTPPKPIERGYLVPRRYTDPDQTPLEDVVDQDHSGYKEIVLED